MKCASQSKEKGRARKKPATYLVMVDRDDLGTVPQVVVVVVVLTLVV